jgi:hypothetical protein
MTIGLHTGKAGLEVVSQEYFAASVFFPTLCQLVQGRVISTLAGWRKSQGATI